MPFIDLSLRKVIHHVLKIKVLDLHDDEYVSELIKVYHLLVHVIFLGFSDLAFLR